MAPFPTRRNTLTTVSYPPPPSRSPPPPGLGIQPVDGMGSPPKRNKPIPSQISTDPGLLFGQVGEPGPGVLGGPGRTWESGQVVRGCLNPQSHTNQRSSLVASRLVRNLEQTHILSSRGLLAVIMSLTPAHSQHNHLNHHIFTNEKRFHNHTAHHLLAAYSMGASSTLLKDIYEIDSRETMTMPPLQTVEINEANWTDFLDDASYYPNYLAFFNRLISTPPIAPSLYAGRSSSVIPVLERYLFTSDGAMLNRALSGAIHPLIHVGYGLEFGLDGLVAEGLAQAACQRSQVGLLFDAQWPPSPPKPTSFQSTMTNALSSLKLGASSSFLGLQPIASPTDSFTRTCARLPRQRRIPREGLSGFTILDRILHDPHLAAGNAHGSGADEGLDSVLSNRGEEIKGWCEEWKFSTDSSVEYEDEGRPQKGEKKRSRVPEWEEIVEKCEELMWMATVIYAAASRPGYVNTKMDFFTMHGLTSALFLPTYLEQISPHLRPCLLHSHLRVLIAYWISRGRPNLFIKETLLSATATPLPPKTPSFLPGAVAKALVKSGSDDNDDAIEEAESPQTPQVGEDGQLKKVEGVSTPPEENAGEGESHGDADERTEGRSVVNPWPSLIASACDHPDDHVPKVIRSLAFCATHFGHSPPGMFQCSLPGTEKMDGSIFIRAAGLTFQGLGYMREGEPGGAWDFSKLGFDSAWAAEERRAGFESKGKGRAYSTSDETVVEASAGGSSIVGENEERVADAPAVGGFVGEGRESWEESQARVEREEREEEERALMG